MPIVWIMNFTVKLLDLTYYFDDSTLLVFLQINVLFLAMKNTYLRPAYHLNIVLFFWVKNKPIKLRLKQNEGK